MDLSTEVLINSEYKVICPQCLCQLQIVGDYAYIPHDELNLDTSVEPSRTINCPHCGHEASTGVHLCPVCGGSLDAPATVDTTIEDATVIPPPIPDSDPLYNDAVQFLMTCTAITPMMLRDHFHISDERAAELLRQLEAGGVVGPYNNGGPRQILIPHRQMYFSNPRQINDLGQEQNPMDSRPQPRRMGCVSWMFMTFLLVLLLKACGL